MAHELSAVMTRSIVAGGKMMKCRLDGDFASIGTVSTHGMVRLPGGTGMGSRLQLVTKSSHRSRLTSVVHASGQTALEFRSCPAEGNEGDYSSQSTSSRTSSMISQDWLNRSLAEIVRHLPEAPFLQLVFNSSSLLQRVERLRVPEVLFNKPERWDPVRERLLSSAPDGVILVHRLDQESVLDCGLQEKCKVRELMESSNLEGGQTDVWGVLVQGCGAQCHACYFLKTTQIACALGTLTHFSLFPANCLGASMESQLQTFWLG